MAEAETHSDPIDILAIEFVASLRDGRRPAIDDYAQRHPDLANDIRELFPTIACLERARTQSEATSDEGRATLGPAQLTRLGDLRIVREIGRGGMGIVYEAEQESLRRRVAVKVLPRQALLDDRQLRRFEREARTAANLHHTNIVPILGVGESDGFRYYVMQYIRGVSLDQILPQISNEDSRNGTGKASTDASSLAQALVSGKFDTDGDESGSISTAGLVHDGVDSEEPGHVEESGHVDSHALAPTVAGPAATLEGVSAPDSSTDVAAETNLGPQYWLSVARIGLQVSSALDYAHEQGTLHRDIKPANLIVDPHGTAWVADFGLAKAIEHDDVSRTGDIVGTLKYMAPEQVVGEADARSDLFSLGLTLYELLTLQPAYDDAQRRDFLLKQATTPSPAPPRRLNPSIPRDLETIVLKCIAPEVDHRYQSAEELTADLQRYLDGRPIHARRIMPWERLWRWARRNPALATTSAAALVLLCTVAVMSSVGYVHLSEAHGQTQSALGKATEQHQLAEENATLALSALDRIFERFAPTGLPSAFDGTDGNQMEASAVLSNEAADLLAELVNFYKTLREQRGDDPAYQERIGLANRRLGDIDQRLGRYEQAATAYDRALAIYAPLAESSSSPEHTLALAGLYTEMGNTQRSQRDFEKAAASYASAEQLLEPLAEGRDNDLATFELARVYHLQVRGNALAPARLRSNKSQRLIANREEAERKLQWAVDRLHELTARQPANPAYAHMLGLLYLEASSFHRRSDPTVAADYQHEAVEILDTLDENHPENPDYALALCAALATGSPRDGKLRYQDLDAFAERLIRARNRAGAMVESHPQVPQYRALQAMLHHKLGTVLMRLEFDAEAEQSYAETIDIYRTLASRYPEASDYYEVKRAFARQSLAGLLLTRTDRESAERARDELIAAIATIEAVPASPNDQATIDSRLHGCYRQLADAYRRLGEDARALEAERKSS